MDSDHGHIPDRLKEIIEEFQLSEGREKVELLLYYAESMPNLPEKFAQNQEAMDLVEECMTPVHVAAEVNDNRMSFYFDVPAESPTVRGFAALIAEGLDGATPQAVLEVPNDFYLAMGLEKVLTMQRMNGIAAILAHMKQLAVQTLEN